MYDMNSTLILQTFCIKQDIWKISGLPVTLYYMRSTLSSVLQTAADGTRLFLKFLLLVWGERHGCHGLASLVV